MWFTAIEHNVATPAAMITKGKREIPAEMATPKFRIDESCTPRMENVRKIVIKRIPFSSGIGAALPFAAEC
jgi:hypothetical protein